MLANALESKKINIDVGGSHSAIFVRSKSSVTSRGGLYVLVLTFSFFFFFFIRSFSAMIFQFVCKNIYRFFFFNVKINTLYKYRKRRVEREDNQAVKGLIFSLQCKKQGLLCSGYVYCRW